MTVLVWDGTTLAADRQATIGELRRSICKIAKHKGALLAWCGLQSVGLVLAEWWINGADPEKYPAKHQENDDTSTSFYVIHPDKTVDCYERTHLPIRVLDKQWAAGSGRDFAYGALAMGADAVQAVNAAAVYCTSVGMGVDTMTPGDW